MKIESLYKIFPYLVVAFFVVSCASSGTLSGGPKDETAPKLIQDKSSQNIIKQYDGQEITMVFDEFVEIANKKEIVVSPPTKYPIIVKQRGKKVKVKFDKREVLKPDATYFLGFDNVVKDYTEGNKLEKLSYVITEGEVIDSAAYEGKFIYPDKTKKDLLIMMYKEDQDSIVTKEKPFYYAKSKDGAFKFKYIKDGTYKVVAFEDKNLNLVYDQETDWIAFMDTTLVVKDSMETVVLKPFLPKQPLKIIKKTNDKFGEFSIEYNQPIKDLRCKVLSDSMPVFFTYEENKIIGKYNFANRNLKMLCGSDSVKVKLAKVDSTLFKNKLAIDNGVKAFTSKEEVVIKWKAPLKNILSDSITVSTKKDTVEQKLDVAYSFKNDSIIIKGLEQGRKYNVLFDSLAVTDIYNRVNDSLAYKFEILSDTSLVDMTVKLDSTFAERQANMIVEIFAGRQKIDSQSIKFDKEVTFKGLKPQKYNVTIIKDDNNDKTWTTGDYWLKRQPEEKFTEEKTINKSDTYWVNWAGKKITTNSSNQNKEKQNNEASRGKLNKGLRE